MFGRLISQYVDNRSTYIQLIRGQLVPLNHTVIFFRMNDEYPMTEFEFHEESEGFKEADRLYSASRSTIAIVGEKPNGTFTYALYQWVLTDSDYVGGGYWSCCDLGGMYGEYGAAQSEAKQSISCHK